jgi:hypothetical protein
MQMDRRFADYGLTGGFFLISQLALLWALGYWPSILTELQAVRLPPDNSLLAPIITGFTGAVALIAVFVAGLMLDLLASLFRASEMRMFARHLELNRDWIAAFVEAHKAYCGADYERFQGAFRDPPLLTRLWLAATYVFTFWKRESRLRYAAAVKVGWGLGLAPGYERLLSFFTSYVMGQSGSAELTLMADQYSLWRAARAIATALYLLMCELLLIFWFQSVFGSKLLVENFIDYIAVLFVATVGLGLIVLIIQGTYSRLCFTLFSLVYVVGDKQIVSPKNAEPAP